MFKNFSLGLGFKIAWRSLKSQRLFTILNILGLSWGLAVSFLMFLFIMNELSFDKMYKNEKNIYRVLTLSETYENLATAPNAVGPVMLKELPEVTSVVRLIKHGFGTKAFIKAGEKEVTEPSFYAADSTLFQVFDIPFVEGDPLTSLSRPNTVVLSASAARRYFGNEDVVGKTITVDNNQNLEVTGVFKDLPDNATLDCNVIASFNTSGFDKLRWGNASFETYLLLNPNANIAAVEKKMQQVLDKNMDKEDQWYTLSLQPLSKVHLYSSAYSDGYSSRTGDIKEVRNLLLLGIIILLIACINYMNLATARSQKKAKEVAINKTLGASSGSLIFRFYTETGVLTFLAILAGLLLAIAGLPLFNNITGRAIPFSNLTHFNFLAGLLSIWLLVTFISGSYPAFFLTSFSPIFALKQATPGGRRTGLVRKGLVIAQFASSVILIFGVIVIYQQMTFIRNKNLGFRPENVVALDVTAAQTKTEADVLKNELINQPGVMAVTFAQAFPGMSSSGRTLRKNEEDKSGTTIMTNRTQPGIVKALGIRLLAGSDLPVKAEGDTIVHVILNKKAVDYLGITPAQAVGRKILANLGDNSYVSGVVDNFNFASLHEPMGAYAFNDAQMEPIHYCLVRFSTSDLRSTINGFEKAFKNAIPNTAFDFTFLDQYLNHLYVSEQRMANVVLLFSILAIVIACMGLFGLAAFTAEQRTKEVGIRKVLGATVSGITVLLSKDFLKLVGIAILIAAPLGWWMMTKWLQGFAYRVHIGWWVIIAAGLIAVFIALVTVSYQAIRAAVANPVKALKTE